MTSEASAGDGATTPTMSVAFAGTPEFARAALAGIWGAGYRVGMTLTQPDRPAGRGLKLQASAVKTFALEHGIELAQPRSLRLDGKFAGDAAAAQEQLAGARPDVLVVAAYGLLLPGWVLALPRHGCLNIHASLLPRWRGAAPIQRAIEAGDASTGITIMQMDAGLDTGDMVLCESLPIARDDSAATLHDKLAPLGARLIVEALGRVARSGIVATPQPAEGVCYAHKVGKAEAAIDWREDAQVIERRLRAFDPFPGATAVLAGETIKCWRGEVVAGLAGAQGLPGHVLELKPSGIVVACGRGALRLAELQRAGGRRLPVAQFLHGKVPETGMVFELLDR